jgi:hypothetical protein
MPIDEVTGSVVGGILRLVAWLFFDVFIEIVIQGTGYRILRWVRPEKTPSDAACTLVGLVFWLAIATATFAVVRATLR